MNPTSKGETKMQRGTENESSRLSTPAEFSVQAYFQTLARTIPQMPYASIQQIIAAIMQAFEKDRTIFVFGNGGSAATASHVMCDLSKGTIGSSDSPRLKVMSFTDNVPLLTAWANDAGYEHVFSQQVRNFVRPGDVVLAISGSGNSPSIIEALKTARDLGAIILGMAGFQGGEMRALCDVCAVVPSDNIQVVEDLHHAIAHAMLLALRQMLGSQTKKVVGGATAALSD